MNWTIFYESLTSYRAIVTSDKKNIQKYLLKLICNRGPKFDGLDEKKKKKKTFLLIISIYKYCQCSG